MLIYAAREERGRNIMQKTKYVQESIAPCLLLYMGNIRILRGFALRSFEYLTQKTPAAFSSPARYNCFHYLYTISLRKTSQEKTF